jgi:hypothetical protein
MESSRQSRPQRSSRSRSRSRPRRSDNAPLHRILSSQFPDDHSVYHHEDGEGIHVDSDASSLHKTETERRDANTASSDDDDSGDDVDEKEAKDDTTHEEETTYEEIRGGIPYEHDVEASPPLEKKKSTRSVKDPNLVCSPNNHWLVLQQLTSTRLRGIQKTILVIRRIVSQIYLLGANRLI